MNGNDDSHPCPINDCAVRRLPHHLLACAAHWRLVPHDLQSEVYRLWRLYQRDVMRYGTQYLAARQAAIDVVNARIARTRATSADG